MPLFGGGSSILINVNASGTLVPQQFTPTGGQTVFTLTLFSYTPSTNSLLVFINGTLQVPGVDYTETSSTSFTLTSAVTALDSVRVIGFPLASFFQAGVGTALTDIPSVAIVQASAYAWGGTAGGTANALTVSTSPVPVAYAAGQVIRLIASAANTGTTTLKNGALGVITAKKISAAGLVNLTAGDIVVGGCYQFVYDGTYFQVTAASLTAATQAYNDNSTNIATTAWAKVFGGLIGGQSWSFYYASATLAATDIGRPIYYNSGSAGTLTLPTGVTGGQSITVYNLASGLLTIARGGASLLYAQGQFGATSISLGQGDSVCLVSDGANWVQLLGSSQLGIGQTWQDVTASRAFGTTYYNTTGKPIEVAAAVYAPQGYSCYIQLACSGVTVSTSGSYSPAGNEYFTLSMIVPIGAAYAAYLGGSGGSLYSWSELR